LKTLASRPAKVGDKLVTTDFGTRTRGFSERLEITAGGYCHGDIAICLLPGTELAFDAPIAATGYLFSKVYLTQVARFTQVGKHILHAHHDALELPGEHTVKLTLLLPGQTATVLQLPAEPKNDKEAEEQKRVAFAG
jgi:hypothetical protein